MLISEIARESLVSLWQNKGRTFLSVLGILIGIASVITMVAIGNGSQAQIAEQIQALGANLITISPKGSGKLKPSDVKIMQASNYQDLMTYIAPEQNSRQTVVYQDNSESITVYGVTIDYLNIYDRSVMLGNFFVQEEVESKSRVAIIGLETAETFFGNSESALYKKITINNLSYEIIGVLKSIGSNRDNLVVVPLTTMQTQISNSQEYSSIVVKLANVGQLELVKSIIGYTLLDAHNIETVAEADFNLFSSTDLLETLSGITQTFTLLLASIAGISLLVGGIGIMNVMLMSVLERTREIGLRKALGAKKVYIIVQFIIEALLITLIGGAIGVILGFGVCQVISYFFELKVIISSSSVMLALGISMAIGLIFGIYPANKAAKMTPIEALRHD